DTRDVDVRVVRLDWDYEGGERKTKEVDAQDCRVRTSGKPEACAFVAKEGGMHKIVATVKDDKGRTSVTEVKVWAAGGELPPARGVTREKVQLLTDKKEYRAGDTAEVLVIPPWTPAQGFMTVRRDGILRTEPFAIKEGSATLKIPLEEAW